MDSEDVVRTVTPASSESPKVPSSVVPQTPSSVTTSNTGLGGRHSRTTSSSKRPYCVVVVEVPEVIEKPVVLTHTQHRDNKRMKLDNVSVEEETSHHEDTPFPHVREITPKAISPSATSTKAESPSVTSIKGDSPSATSIKGDSPSATSIKGDSPSATSIKGTQRDGRKGEMEAGKEWAMVGEREWEMEAGKEWEMEAGKEWEMEKI
ncbi:hypothetical protein Pmani_019124 [Petrolisthes manimaculis]|uniref:Uncharacterized protein n=1 Tax=Petrolisthes manimaculis TaxID=1843537 RepID=A0AAE1PLG3_9EUCA|nr:hypothetical protein Pmani_019124 [Petrolisthes manimaculis]